MIRSILRSLFIPVLFLIPFSGTGQVIANFTADDTAGCAPMVIHFTNTSTGATSYNWDLGNGTISTLTDVSGAYLTAGTYTITLVAHNGSSSNTRTMTIRVYGLPTVNFSASDTTVCPGTPVTFTSTSVPNAWGGLTYNWNFGDGLTSSATSPVHSYPLSGYYNVTLFATNVKGCINSRSRNPYIRVYNTPSVGLSAGSTYFCHPPALATFSNSTIGVGPLSSFWRFGDGGTSTITNPTHNYTVPGNFDISLRVTDGNGCVDSVLFPAYVTVSNLISSFTSPTSACKNGTVTFNNTSTSHLSSQWDFGDGGTSTIESPDHMYTATGTYNVKLIIFDGVCYDTVTHPISIVHPTGSFSISPAQPCNPPRLMTYTASIPPGCTATWYSMVYGSYGTGNTVSHLYPLRYNMAQPLGTIDSITMVITNSIGCKDTIGKRDTIDYLEVYLTGGNFRGCTPLSVPFVAMAISYVYDPFSFFPYYAHGYPPAPSISYPYPYPVSSYTWNFGDGTPTSSVPSPTHTYTLIGGVYVPSVSITTANGCTVSAPSDQPVKVGTPPPAPTFTRSPSRICAGQSIHFVSTASGVFDHYAWDFGDGYSDSLPNPTHVFTVPGIFTAELIMYYNGCPSTHYILKDTVDEPNASIAFRFDCIPATQISFGDSSVGDDSHLWQFGDGSTSTAFNPVHVYSAYGIYSVTLTTLNFASGCRDTSRYSLQVLAMPSGMNPYRLSLCKDAPDTIAAYAMGEPGTHETYVNKYKWYFDGIAADTFLTIYEFDTVYHSFHTAGTHLARLILTDNHGCFDTLDQNILVAQPVDSFDFSPPSGCAPLPVTFTDHTTDVPGITISNYYWLFGDGYSASGPSPTVTHVYTANGTYNVKMVVTDILGCKDSLISSSHPVARRPTAAFNATPTTVCAKRSVHFTNTTSGTFTSQWFFGDGDTSTSLSPNHIYSVAGTYTVKLVVTNSFGCRDTLIKTNYITVKPLPIPSFYMDDSFAVCSPLNVNFHNTSTGATSYFWTFGDGTSSSSPTPSDVYITPGYYTVKLLAINAFSCTDTAIGHVNLFGYSGAFTYTPHSGCNPQPIHFSATVPPVASLIWDFSDGVTSVPSLMDTITHVYSTTGTYIPKLILTDSFGCTNFSVGVDTIKIDNIAADFTITPNPVCPFNVITFHDTATSFYSPVTGWLWTFAPGYTSTASSPTFSYSVSGSHPVSLSVTDAWGCTAVITKNVVVNSLPSPISGPSSTCIGTSITLTDTASGGIWTSSNTAVGTVGSNTGVVTGISLGTTTISYLLGTGCIATKTVTVNPVLTPITGPTGVCVGATIALSNATTGGTWSSGSTGIATVGSSSGIVTGVAGGPVTISYTHGGCAATKTITVNALPSAIAGIKNVCIGLTTSLTSTPAGGAWSSGSPSIATIGTASGTAYGASPGTSVITYTLSTGCAATTILTVNAYPAPISGSSFVCIGGSTTFTDATGGGTWTSTNTSIATVGSITGLVSGIATGTDTIKYSVAGCSVSRSVTVSSMPPPIAGPDNVCMSSAITLSHPTPGGTWSSGSPFIATVGSASGLVSGTHIGATTISYTLGGGCVATIDITVNPLPSTITGSMILCVGTTTTLADVSVGGTWSSGTPAVGTVGSATGIVSGIAAGTAIITYTLPTNCYNTTTVTVNSVSPITGLTNLCAWGDTVTVHDADPTGSYSSSSVTIVNLGGGSGRITANAPGTALITYTLPSGCAYSTTFTINPLPSAISGNMHLCAGGTTTFSDTPSTGGTWSSSLPSVGTIDAVTGFATALSGGITRIKYTLATGCKVDTPLFVTPIPAPANIAGPSSVCKGATILLTDTTTGGVWSASNGNATVSGGTVTGVTSGIDTIKYLISNSCGSGFVAHVITVNPLPDAGTINGPATLCVNQHITLTDTATGGTWSTWGSHVSVSAGDVTGLAAGTDTVIYTVTNMCGTATAKHPVTVNPLPDAGTISGPSKVCVGDTITMSGSVAGGTLTLTNNHAVLSGWVVTGVSAGVDTVLYTVTNICGTATTSRIITIDPLPYAGAINGPTGMCVGDSISLSETVSGGTWTSSNNSVELSGSLLVKGLTAGGDTIRYTVSNSCGTATASWYITINPLPDGLTITRKDNVLSIASGYAAYQWTHNGTPIPGATSSTYAFTDTGAYGVIVMNSFGCSFEYPPYMISNCSVTEIEVFPNPASSVIYIQWCKQVNARLSCMDGKVLKELKNVTEIAIGELPNAVYTLTLYDAANNKLVTKRITKLSR